MIILISGLTACGKSYQAKLLAKALDYKYYCASDILLNKIPNSYDNEVSQDTEHFWIKEENCNYIDKYRDDNNLDRQLDSLLLDIANNTDNAVFDTRTLPWLYQGDNSIKVYLNPSLDDRSKIAYNSKDNKDLSIDELKIEIDKKDQKDISRFKKLYGIDISDDSDKMFDLVIDNGPLLPEHTHMELLKYVRTAENK